MERRQFLHGIIGSLASLGFGRIAQSVQETTGETSILKEMLIIDAHAHPAGILRPAPVEISSRARAIEPMKELGAVTSSFSAVGDVKKVDHFYDRTAASYEQAMEQLKRAKEVLEFVGAKIVRTSSDIPKPSDSANKITGLLSLEGADPLEKDPDRMVDFYQYGVRIITLMHYRINRFGDIMTARPEHKGLTRDGDKLISRMQELGIVVDVAHAHIDTLKDIAKVTNKPLIDSHTSVSYSSLPTGGRRRTWKEMEVVVGTGGVVCMWLLAVKSKTLQRKTFYDWAMEIKAMKERFGIEHIGLGTDTGGYFRGTRLMEGYKNLLDLRKLVEAMLAVGLTKTDISAFMGGNIFRVLKKCIG